MSLRLDAIVEGPDDADTLFFLQGWPDDATLWDPHVASLVDRHRCVRTTLPNFDGARDTRWGYETDEIVGALARLLEEVAPGRPVTLILHDWGCYWGFLLQREHPERICRIAALDVAPHAEPGPAAMLGIVAYQWWLIGALALGGPVGDWMTRALAGALRAPLSREQIHSGMNYPYRNVWRDLARGRARAASPEEWPKVPLLFVYGRQKPFPFHSKAWLDYVRSGGGTVVGLDCDHWVPRDPAFGEILTRWLDETALAAPARTG